jgi:diamine N-acetyltransferase
MKVFLRALEPSDIDVLYTEENDTSIWKYSNRSQPYSKATLQKYIANSHEDIYTAGQLRFVIATEASSFIGMVDLFDFEPQHSRAGVGLLIRKDFRNQGYGLQALKLLEMYVQQHLSLHQLYACFAVANEGSKKLFEKMGYLQGGIKKDWIFYEGAHHDVLFYQKIL